MSDKSDSPLEVAKRRTKDVMSSYKHLLAQSRVGTVLSDKVIVSALGDVGRALEDIIAHLESPKPTDMTPKN